MARLMRHLRRQGGDLLPASVRIDTVELYANGGQYFEALFDALEQAERLICLEYYIIRADQPYRPAAFVAHRHAMILHPAIFAAAEADAVFAREAGRLSLQGGPKRGPIDVEILRMDAGIPLLASALVGGGGGAFVPKTTTPTALPSTSSVSSMVTASDPEGSL